MENSFSEVMSRLPEKKLIRIVTIEKDSRDPLAVQAAEAELAKRGVDEHKIRRTVDELKVQMISVEVIASSKVPRWLRLSHNILDMICFYLIVYAVNYLIVELELTEDQFLIQLQLFAVQVLSFFWYFVFTEWKYHQTLGKMLTRCHVEKVEGGFADFETILKRTFCRLIPFDAIFYLLTGTMLHDKLSDTVVIRKRFVEEEGIEKTFVPDVG